MGLFGVGGDIIIKNRGWYDAVISERLDKSAFHFNVWKSSRFNEHLNSFLLWEQHNEYRQAWAAGWLTQLSSGFKGFNSCLSLSSSWFLSNPHPSLRPSIIPDNESKSKTWKIAFLPLLEVIKVASP